MARIQFNDFIMVDCLLSLILGIGVGTEHETGEIYILIKVSDGWAPTNPCVITQE